MALGCGGVSRPQLVKLLKAPEASLDSHLHKHHPLLRDKSDMMFLASFASQKQVPNYGFHTTTCITPWFLVLIQMPLSGNEGKFIPGDHYGALIMSSTHLCTASPYIYT